jgi:hypothetical protein
VLTQATASYEAFESELASSSALTSLAACRQRSNVTVRSSFLGNGDSTTGLRGLLTRVPLSTSVIMIDPIKIGHGRRACEIVLLAESQPLALVLFGLRARVSKSRGTKEFDEYWPWAVSAFSSQARIEWRWTGAARANGPCTHDYFLLVALKSRADSLGLVSNMQSEHAVLQATRAQSHGYVAAIPPHII